MINSLPNRVANGAKVVLGNSLAARQFEPYLERDAATKRSAAWISPAIHTYQTWTAALWSATATDARRLLTTSQSQSLWRRVIDNSTIAEQLISSHSACRWAADAWQTLWQWQVDPTQLHANDEGVDFRSFLGWAHSYRSALADNGWIDGPLAVIELIDGDRLGKVPADTVIWADIPEPTPVQQALYRRLGHEQWALEEWRPPDVQRNRVRVALPDRLSEISAAAQWAAARLAQRPAQRLALVIPDLKTHASEVRRVVEDTLEPDAIVLGSANAPAYFNPSGEPGDLRPAIGAAMTALELLSARGTFQSLSRWLRSPYFLDNPGNESERSMVEASLRTEVSAQLRFRQAFREGSLARRLRETAPELAGRLAQALRTLDSTPRYATPTRWIRVWQQILLQLGWQHDAQSPDAGVLPLWESALNGLSLLTPIVGTVSMTQALDELDLILAQPRSSGPIPLTGISLLERLEDVGPGYDAVWLTGLTDANWPRPAHPNPLLPLRLQRAHDMPGASPRNALERCQRATRRLIERTPELVCSWPSRVHDYPSEPSPLLTGIPDVGLETLISGRRPRLAQRLQGSGILETIGDKAPPLEGQEIIGGATTLSVQAKCPLRAFIESRLRARPLEAVARGLSPRQRGIVTHRTLELFLRRLPGQAELAAWPPADQQAWAANCAEQALQETFGSARTLLPVAYRLEYERLLRITASLLQNDLSRQDFHIDAVEKRQVAQVNGYRLICRLDRVDSLATGGVAVIDYKTGSSASPADWFKARLRDTQLPLYAQAMGDSVTATVIAVVHGDGIQFKGIWAPGEEFPGRSAKLPAGRDWPAQLASWREQLEGLVSEYADGDTRILIHDLDAASGAFAPVTRVIEQLALSRALTGPGDVP